MWLIHGRPFGLVKWSMCFKYATPKVKPRSRPYQRIKASHQIEHPHTSLSCSRTRVAAFYRVLLRNSSTQDFIGLLREAISRALLSQRETVSGTLPSAFKYSASRRDRKSVV